jgi:hypothetical protein
MSRVSAGASLTPAETVQYSYVLRVVLYDVQEAFVLHGDGRLDEAFWQTRAQLVRAYLSNPFARQLYARDRDLGLMLPEFTAWVDSTVAGLK